MDTYSLACKPLFGISEDFRIPFVYVHPEYDEPIFQAWMSDSQPTVFFDQRLIYDGTAEYPEFIDFPWILSVDTLLDIFRIVEMSGDWHIVKNDNIPASSMEIYDLLAPNNRNVPTADFFRDPRGNLFCKPLFTEVM